jgi:hypothetical protein
MVRNRWTIMVALAVVVLAVAVAGGSLLPHSDFSTPVSSRSASVPPSVAAEPSPTFAVYAVNPGATSIDVGACVGPAYEYGRGQADWGENYESGARIYLNFTGHPQAHVADLRRLLPSTCAIYVRIVAVSSAEGRALQARIDADMPSLQTAGVPVNCTGFDPVSGRVTVCVFPLTAPARAELNRRYGAANLNIVESLPAVPLASS